VKNAIKLVVSLAITGACFWWTFKDTHWAEMWNSVRTANYLLLLPYLGILTLVHLTRTLRWGSLLSGIEKVPFQPLNEAAGIGFMMLIVLPFRLGEFARPFLIAERSKIRRSAAMTSVVFERIVDGISIAIMLRLLLFFVPNTSPEINRINWGANLMFAVFGGGLLFLLFARWQHDRAVRLISATAGRISPKLGDKVAHVVDGFVGAMKQLPDTKNLIAFFAMTAGYWALNGVGISLLANAFDCHGAVGSCEPLSLSVFQGFVVLGVLIIGLMIPAAPGSAGTFQAFIILGLRAFLPAVVVNSSGVAFANVLWVVQILQQVLFGLVLMLLSKGNFKGITGKLSKEEDDDAPKEARGAA
jgi:uncharacterized protein (TIRG00374 family)